MQAAKDADTPFIAAYLRSTTSTSGYKIISNWAASAEELDFVTPPASLSSSPDSSTYVAQDQFSNPSAAAGTLVSQAQQYDYLGLQLNAAVNRSSSPTLTLEYTDGTSTFTYDVDWDYLPFEGTLSAANYGTAEWGIPANTQTVFFVKQQAVANGAQGVLGFRGKQSLWLSSFERSPAVFTDNAVTQEDIDAYQAALAALAAWERAINRPYRGIESVVTLKPTRDATTVAAVIERDYQPLIVAGTLANLLVMLNRDWTNVEMAMMYRARYEIELGHARQAIDRNFITGSQKIKPRRFAASAYRGR